MNFQVQSGVYPTMITPYKKSGEIDYEAVEKLVEWYWKQGCDGPIESLNVPYQLTQDQLLLECTSGYRDIVIKENKHEFY